MTSLPGKTEGRAQVHVWRVDVSATDSKALRELLSTDEQGRAARFRFDRDRRQYIAARGALRSVLGDSLGVAPSSLTFSYTQYGKPYLADATVSFNVSHSGDVVLIAIAAGIAVGVDVERLRSDLDCEHLATRFFSQSEQAELLALAPDEQIRAFFACWTRKEAFIKGVGDGLSIPLDTFDVNVGPDEPARLLASRTDPDASRRWSLADVAVPPDYAAAVALEHPVTEVMCREWAQPAPAATRTST